MEIGGFITSLATNIARAIRATLTFSFMVVAVSGTIAWFQDPPLVFTVLGEKVPVARVVFLAAMGFLAGSVALEMLTFVVRCARLPLLAEKRRLTALSNNVAVAEKDRAMQKWELGNEWLNGRLWDENFQGPFFLNFAKTSYKDSIRRRHLRLFEADGFITMSQCEDEEDLDVESADDSEEEWWEITLDAEILRRRLYMSLLDVDDPEWRALDEIQLSTWDRFKIAALALLISEEKLDTKQAGQNRST